MSKAPGLRVPLSACELGVCKNVRVELTIITGVMANTNYSFCCKLNIQTCNSTVCGCCQHYRCFGRFHYFVIC